ncbi:MAG: IclR family transcriptional regulator C-terminal domain-containing protein, partial [Deltaproteobacteria bacterium]|nr:IclR family transcriptional regulator C-terminal domain-containing protein [Deltaproteobacteria bacterium]
SGGKAFLAFSSDDVRTALLKGKLIRLTRNSITDKKKLEHHFEEIRRQGFSFDRAEFDEGIQAVSVPIFDYENKPIASATVAGTPQRITGKGDSSVVLELKRTAKKISERFGYKNIDSK